MWFSLTYVEPGETPDAADEPLALVSIFRPDATRIMRMRTRLEALPEVLRWIRAASEGAPRGMVPCPHCGDTFGVPDLDREAPCATS